MRWRRQDILPGSIRRHPMQRRWYRRRSSGGTLSGVPSGRAAAAIRDAAESGSIPPREACRGSAGMWISTGAIRTFRR